MTSVQSTIIETVAEDLRFLRETCDESVDDHSLRRSSTVLRRLLVEDDYGKAWRVAGFQREPTVNAVDLPGVLARVGRVDLTHAQAGGANYQGREIWSVLTTDQNWGDDDAKQINEALEVDVTRDYRLSEYMGSAAIFYGGVLISRREVILYIANKLGGNHLDLGRSRKRDAAFVLLDDLTPLRFLEKPAAYFELLSIGQAVARSEDASRFRAQAASKAPPR